MATCLPSHGTEAMKDGQKRGQVDLIRFLFPAGTSVPGSLDVKPTPTNNDPSHHSIRCRSLMRLDAHEGALDTLARLALAKAVEAGKQSFFHS